MKPSSFFLFLFLFFTLSLTISAAAGTHGRDLLVGGWAPIKNVEDPHIVEIANFAVSEHNKQANSNLGLSRVVIGETQVVGGINYKLVVKAKDGANYEVIVFEREWEKFRKLISFKAL